MARRKVDKPPQLHSWDDVNIALRRILECESCIDEINVELTRTIAAAKDEADQRARAAQEMKREAEVNVKDFVMRHRDELDGKTKQLNFGRTGFRLSTSLVVPSNKTADVIESLRRYGMEDCITVKESVNKDVLKRYPCENIQRTGAYLKSVDEFWYEVDKETLPDNPA